MELHSSRLDEFIGVLNATDGDFDHPDVQAYLPLDLRFDTQIDQSLDPFSEEYFNQQIALYREISGRELDQVTGELHAFDIEAHLAAPNPTASYNAARVAEQVRALATLVALACLEERPRVLDLGAGGGLSSEVFAYSGCRVHALDIDPLLGRLSLERAMRFGFDIERTVINFDDVGSIDKGYQAAFFYQSFHHCLRPWKLIDDLGHAIDDDGVIGFVGEPVQAVWWKAWGLRLDIESLLVARQHGWFESGWSHEFIRQCFERNGFTLLFFSGGYYGDIGIASRDASKLALIREKAAILDLKERERGTEVSEGRYLSPLGVRDSFNGRPGFTQTKQGPGALMFGPYVTVEPTCLDIDFMLEPQVGSGDGELVIDIVSDLGRKVHFARTYKADEIGRTYFRERLDATEKLVNLEIRAIVNGPAFWNVTLPNINWASEDTKPAEHVVQPSIATITRQSAAKRALGWFGRKWVSRRSEKRRRSI
jgi:2-polyprenyl-3-methyl-5-hydroxy-6-metoxy-1,4-benzoquinol methylase